MGQTTGFDMGYVVPGGFRHRTKQRQLAGRDAFGTKGALAAAKVQGRETTVSLDQDLLRTGRQAVSATGTVGHEVGPGEGPGQPCLGLGRTQSASKQTTA
ncbi:hypothetical protein D3C80_1619090 [compost metagenome]